MAEETIQENQETETKQEPTGLMDGLSNEINQTEEKKSAEISHLEKTDEPATIAEDGKDPEDVEYTKPDFLPDKFWGDDGPELEKLVKSYSELETQFKQGKHKAPKEYNNEIFDKNSLAMDDPTVKSYHEWAVKHGVTQDAYNELAQSIIEISQQNVEDAKFNKENEKKKLGPNADQIIKGVNDFAKGLVRKGVLGADDMNEFEIMAGTAQGIKVLNKIRRYYGEQTIPTTTVDVEGQPSMDELQGMIADPRYLTDAGFRSKVEKLFEKNYGGSVKAPIGQ